MGLSSFDPVKLNELWRHPFHVKTLFPQAIPFLIQILDTRKTSQDALQLWVQSGSKSSRN